MENNTWGFHKTIKGLTITRREGGEEYLLGYQPGDVLRAVREVADHFKKGDVVALGGLKEDILAWDPESNANVLIAGGFSNLTVLFPGKTGMGNN
jgi:hypothetical protein